MNKAKSSQFSLIFVTEVCSFYEITEDGKKELLQEFERFIKINGNQFDFMPYRPQIIIEKDAE